MKAASKIVGQYSHLGYLQHLHAKDGSETDRVRPSRPGDVLFVLLPSGQRLRSITSRSIEGSDRPIYRPADFIGRYSRFLRVSVSAEIIYKQASTQAAPCC